VGPSRRAALKQLKTLTWRGRGGAGTCTAEVDQPIRGYRIGPKPKAGASSDAIAGAPTVAWISFDGDVFWVRLADAPGWPRTIRVTQADVDGTVTRGGF
jgi:hypothetical protein